MNTEEKQRLIGFIKPDVYCEMVYETSKGGTRTIKGAFQGIEKGNVVLLNNNRRNKAPVGSIIRVTYNKEQQGASNSWIDDDTDYIRR